MNTVQRFKLRKILKALLGTLLKKGWDWLSNSALIGAIAESPAVMTASGWRVDRNENSREARQVNEEAAKFFSDNGKKVIKYDNKIEGGGTSYMITDPSVFYNPLKYNWQQIMNRTKYPIMYETNQ